MSNFAADKCPPSHRYCYNCHYPLPSYGDYCNHCGQKHGPNKVKVGSLIRELLESVINFDSRFLRTVGDLVFPGKLTEAYFLGRRQRYIPPVRIFFLMAILHFAIGSNLLKEGLTDGLNEIDTNEAAYHTLFMDDLQRQSDTLLTEMGSPPTAGVLVDSLYARLHADQQDSLRSSLPQYDGEFKFRQFEVALSDTKEMTTDSLLDHYEVYGFWNRLVVKQWLKMNFEAISFSSSILGNLIWMVILMMPALALVLKLLYIRRRRYFVEHLVFSFHYHAFAFFVFSIAFLLLARIDANTEAGADSDASIGLIISLAFGLTWLYQYLAMKRIYKQGWLKTFVKSCALNVFYLFIFTFFLLLTFAFAALTF